MNRSKVVGQRKARTPAEFHVLGARLDQELSVVRPFTRNAVLFQSARLVRIGEVGITAITREDRLLSLSQPE